MDIGVLGTGMVGRALAGKLAALGYEVTIGTQDVAALMVRTEPDAMGNEPFATWAEQHGDVSVVTFADAADRAGIVVDVTNGAESLDALCNPLEPSGGCRPSCSSRTPTRSASRFRASSRERGS